MKKLLALLLAGALVLSMSACCCCLPTDGLKLPDVNPPAANSSKPTGSVIIQIPTDPTEPTEPPTVPPTTPPTKPIVPGGKEVSRCVFASYQDGNGNPWFQQKLQLTDGFISNLETIGYDGQLRHSSICYDWKARMATITSDDPDNGSQEIFWDSKGQINQIRSSHGDTTVTVYNYYTFFGKIKDSTTYVNGLLESRAVYEYNENQQMTSYAYYDSRGIITNSNKISYNEYGDPIMDLWYENGELTSDYRYTYTYDEEGRVLTETTVFGDSGHFVSKYAFNYNEKGLLESEYSFAEEGFPIYWDEYTYNEDGLETKRTHFTLEGVSDIYMTEYTKDGQVLRRSSYSQYDGSPVLQNVELFDYSSVYVTELEDAVQQNLFDLITGWGL